jgi:broad specificity phosphatase PhoE
MIEHLFLVRHGETLDNTRGVAQGWGDSELSVRGRRQVDALAQRLVSTKATGIFSSSLVRARTTANVISEAAGLPVIVLDDLREMNYGEWEQQSFLSVRERYADVFRQWSDDPDIPCPGGGESHRNVFDRVMRALATIDAAGEAGRRPIVVSHGTAIRILTTGILSLPLGSARSFAQDNAAINHFIWRSDRHVLKLWNDTTHCAEGLPS